MDGSCHLEKEATRDEVGGVGPQEKSRHKVESIEIRACRSRESTQALLGPCSTFKTTFMNCFKIITLNHQHFQILLKSQKIQSYLALRSEVYSLVPHCCLVLWLQRWRINAIHHCSYAFFF
jgi:hypothetical protein